MNETFSYGGHSIDLVMHESRSGYARYTYFIDSDLCFESAIDATTDGARDNAIARAQASIDALNCLKRRFPGAPSGALRSAVGVSDRPTRDRVDAPRSDLDLAPPPAPTVAQVATPS